VPATWPREKIARPAAQKAGVLRLMAVFGLAGLWPGIVGDDFLCLPARAGL
jgi:hypothetical protein